MENISISHFENDAVQDKKLESYDWGKDNFLAGQELTVTVTLREYRELVASKATADQTVQASREKVVKLEAELKEAKAEAERLKAENYDLQNKVLAAQSRCNAQIVEREYSGKIGITTINERFAPCAGERCMAHYKVGGREMCRRLEAGK